MAIICLFTRIMRAKSSVVIYGAIRDNGAAFSGLDTTAITYGIIAADGAIGNDQRAKADVVDSAAANE